MVVLKQTNLATGLEVVLPTPYLVVPSPLVPSQLATSILEREVLAARDLIPTAGGAQVLVVPVQAPVVDAIGCWSQIWVMIFQKNLPLIQCQHLLPNNPHLLYFHLSNNDGSLPKRRRSGYTRVPWLVLNRYKVSSRYRPLNRAHHFIRSVEIMVLDCIVNSGLACWTC